MLLLLSVRGIAMYTERVETYLHSILPEMGYELDSVTFTVESGIHYLRAFIFRTDGADMTVNDCAAVSRRLSKWLDKEDFIDEEYMLEVCSLGFKEPANDEPTEDEDNEVDAEDGEEEAE